MNWTSQLPTEEGWYARKRKFCTQWDLWDFIKLTRKDGAFVNASDFKPIDLDKFVWSARIEMKPNK